MPSGDHILDVSARVSASEPRAPRATRTAEQYTARAKQQFARATGGDPARAGQCRATQTLRSDNKSLSEIFPFRHALLSPDRVYLTIKLFNNYLIDLQLSNLQVSDVTVQRPELRYIIFIFGLYRIL